MPGASTQAGFPLRVLGKKSLASSLPVLAKFEASEMPLRKL